MEAREYTLEEVREEFIGNLRELSTYWATLHGDRPVKERCDGLVFSILTLLDGMSSGSCGFKIIPDPHPEDKQYHMDNEENWYPFEGDIRENVMMHEEFYVK